jgi:hypothetical protein
MPTMGNASQADPGAPRAAALGRMRRGVREFDFIKGQNPWGGALSHLEQRNEGAGRTG